MQAQHAQTQHAVVWLDHRQAKVFAFDRDHSEEMTIKTLKGFDQAHKHAGTVGGGRTATDVKFLHGIVEALSAAQEWLIIGPGEAKDELVKHIKAHDHTLADRIMGVEPSDHPTDGQIVAHARTFFHGADRMIG
jgi:stalled ribosome rescue protein Dom34